MGNESGKAIHRLRPLMAGRGIDIGCGPCPVEGADPWDWAQGDAQYMDGVEDLTYDWVFSAHCLEHMRDPHTAIQNWWRILKVGGYLIVLVPDEDLYEQCVWPSKFNSDHKRTFTCGKHKSWSPVSINCTDLLRHLPGHHLISLTLEDNGYDYERTGWDQTTGGAEAAVQFVVKKQAMPQYVGTLEVTLGGVKNVSTGDTTPEHGPENSS